MIGMIAWILIAIPLVIRLFYKASLSSADFHVYWLAAQRWLTTDVSPYFYQASDLGFVFKYPPWVLPIFSPVGWLSFEVARFAWAAIELLCMGYVLLWTRRQGVRASVTGLVWLALWWIWQNHFYYGQLTLVLLAFSLWCTPPRDNDGKAAALGVLLSAKIFSVVTMLGLAHRLKSPRVWLMMAAGTTALLGLTLGVMHLHGATTTLPELFEAWMRAAASGGQDLGTTVVRGQMNHGFTAGVLRWSGVGSTQFAYDTGVSLVLAIFFSLIWFRVSKPLSPAETWAGWIAVGLISHPLAWDHSFTLAYPLCALAMERALQTQKRPIIALAALGVICIGILIPNVIGTGLVKPLELVSIKSWGVCFSAAALVWARRETNSSSALFASSQLI